MFTAELVETVAELRSMPSEDLAELRAGFAAVAADESQAGPHRAFARMLVTVIGGMPGTDPVETLQMLVARLPADFTASSGAPDRKEPC